MIRRLQLGCAALAVATLSAGCAVGPDFHRPRSPDDPGFAAAPLPTSTASARIEGGAAQRLVSGHDIPFDWWKSFRCPDLDALIERAIHNSPTIESARAALRQAQELTRASRAAFFPTLQGSVTPSRNLTALEAVSAASSSGKPYDTLDTLQLSVSYSPDVFGATRRTVESQQAQEDMQRYELEAAYVTLASNIVAAAIQEASIRAQIDATNDIIRVNQQSLAILRIQQANGYAMAIDVAAQEAALAAVEQTLPPLQKQLEQTRDLLRVLAGNLPNHDIKENFTFASLHLPEDLPLSLPSKIIEQRPDVRAAEEQMHAASANIGIAVAAMMPQITLTPVLGQQADSFGAMFGPQTAFWSLIGSASQTIFDGGALLHKKRASDEAFVQSAAQYRSTVISAFQNVADTLHALLSDADLLAATVASEQAARHTLDLTRQQSQVGYVNFLTLLQAEQAYQTAIVSRVQAQGSRFSDTAALFQALGGGWWNRTQHQAANAPGAESAQPGRNG